MSLRLLFWNCSVAPVGGQGKRSVRDAARVLDEAFHDGVDLIALCEVDTEAMGAIRKELASRNVRRCALAEPVGHTRWDMGVFYKPDLQCRKRQPALGLNGGRTIRGGHCVQISSETHEIDFGLYLVHWPSRLLGSGSAGRTYAARALHDKVRKDLSNETPVVIMGDFNDEPFDQSLTSLYASRDPRRVLRAPKTWLYNPSWNLAAPAPSDPWASFGSFPYAAGNTSTRYLLDQVLTSAHFLDEPSRRAPAARLATLPSTQPLGARILEHVPVELTLP